MSAINFHTVSGFNNALYQLLKQFEAPHNDARLIGGNVTIGLGFDLKAGGIVVRDAVYTAMGIRIDVKKTPPPTDGTAAQIAAEDGYIIRLDAAALAGNIPQLHAIMAERAGNSVLNGFANNRQTRFEFQDRNGNGGTDDEIRAAFDAALPFYQGEVSKKLFGTNNPNTWTTYQDASGIPLATSREFQVLMSLAWNGGAGLIGDNLKAAIFSGNRAEAWFEIRYGSNRLGSKVANGATLTSDESSQKTAGIDKGLAKRRYDESEVFSLTDNPGSVSGVDEAKQVYRMFTLHRSAIALYEKAYGVAFDSTLGSRGNMIAAANADYGLSGAATVDYIHDALKPAYQTLFADLQTRYPIGMTGLSAGDFNPVNIFIDPGRDNAKQSINPNHGAFLTSAIDPLTGAEVATRDLLIGEGGNDYLMGGKGDDVLIGGQGLDYYYWRTGDGNDRIIDEDRQGIIVINDGAHDLYAAGAFVKQGSSNVWKKITPEGVLTLTHNSPWKLVTADGSEIQLGDFTDGDFGIHLTTNSLPVTPDQLIGTAGADYLNSTSSVPRQVIGGTGKDFIFGTAGADTLDGGADSDWIVGGDGADAISGGDGADYIVGLGSQAQVNGGAGNDIIDARLGASGSSQTSPIDSATAWADLSQYLAPTYTATFPPDGGDTPFNLWGTITSGTVSGISSKGNSWTYQFTFTETNGVTVIADRYFHPTQTGTQGVASGLSFSLYPHADITGTGITADGGDGDDLINGGAGMDVLLGGLGQDRLWGNGGRDTLEGGDGNDVLNGDAADLDGAQQGDDYLDGGAGIDYIWGNGGADIILGGAGGDWLEGDDTLLDGAAHGADLLFGGLGNDYMWGDGGGDSLYGEDGDDYLEGDNGAVAGAYHGNDWLDGGAGNDTLFGDGGSDTLTGGAGQDVLYGDNPDNQPLAMAYQGNDTLDGGDGNDSLYGKGGNDTLLGGTGDDWLDGGLGNDTYVFSRGAGADWISDHDTTTGNVDVVQFLDVASTEVTALNRYGNDLTIRYGMVDQVTVANYFSTADRIEQFQFSDGETWDLGAVNVRVVNNIVGTADNDTLTGSYGSDRLEGGAGNDSLFGDSGSNPYPALGSNDILLGGDGNDWLQGDDRYTAGNDLLDGGTGNDTLLGGEGSDTYLFGKGDGQDQIREHLWSPLYPMPNEFDILQFKPGVTSSEVVVTGNGPNLVFSIAGTSDRITVWYDLQSNDFRSVEQIRFDDGTTWDMTTIMASLFPGTSNADTIFGTVANDTINGQTGDDVIVAGDGDDILMGGNGDDFLDGRAGNDVLDGGPGTDRITSDAGSDTYLFGRGDGQDYIATSNYYGSVPHVLEDGELNVLQFKAGVLPGDVWVIGGLSQGSIGLRIVGTEDQMDVGDFFTATSPVQQVRFADGTVWSASDLAAKYFAGTPDDDILSGTRNSDTISGQAGQDTISGGEGDDVIDGGAGADTLYGDAGNDVIRGGAGDDTLFGSEGDDIIEGGAGNDLIYTSAVHDSAGNDTYLFGKGDGQDTIDADDSGIGVARLNTLQFKPGISSNEVVVTREADPPNGDLLVISIAGTTDKITVYGFFRNNDPTNMANPLQQIKFSDGTSWGLAAITSKLSGNHAPALSTALPDQAAAQGAPFSYTFAPNAFSDPDAGDALTYSAALTNGSVLPSWLAFNATTRTFSGTPTTPGTISVRVTAKDTGNLTASDIFDIAVSLQNLTLNGTVNAETLIGGSGNDTLNGQGGNDTLIGNAGDDTLNGGAGNDTMTGGTGNDTYVVDSVGDIVTETSTLATEIDTVQSSISYTLGANVENLTLTGAAAINGTGNALTNVITGNSADNILMGDAGNDVLTGGAGNDTLDGGVGADTLVGGVGDDDYVIDNVGDVVTENAGEGLGDTVELYLDANYSLGVGIENAYRYGSGNWTTTGNAADNSLYGNSGNDTLVGLGGNDLLWGGVGADMLIGGTGDDKYYVDNAGDVVTENAGEGVDTVYVFGTISYTLAANVENAYSPFWAGNLTGNALNNTLSGSYGADILNGGQGADTLSGWGGNDTYVVDNVGDVVNETTTLATEIDTVQSSISYTLGANVENLALTGIAAINGTGNGLNNTLTGNGANNLLTGGAGDDILYGGASGAAVSKTVGSLVIYARGTPVLGVYPTMQVYVDGVLIQGFTVNAASYTAYTVDPTKLGMAAGKVDVVFTNDAWRPDLGQDRNLYVQKIEVNGQTMNAADNGVFYDLGSGAAAFDGLNLKLGQEALGSNGALRFTLADNDTLDGGTGADQMSGGNGNDTYVFDNLGDVLTEVANEGMDTVRSSISHTLGADLENLALTGSTAINGTGNALNNLLIGNAGNNILYGDAGIDTLLGYAGDDRLDGGAGNDFLEGGLGNDIYVIDSAGDSLWENANAGWDTVESAFSYTLGANFESLTLTGTAAINGTGNSLDNTLLGNSANNVLTGGAGNDTLDGGAGADTMIGGTGDDYYVIDDAGDIVTENAGEGANDSIELYLNADYTLGTEIEYFYRYGSGNWTTTGNAADNSLYGNSGNDTLVGLGGNDLLWGGVGADMLIGGTGDDKYYVDNAGDVVTENAGEGVDTIYVFGLTAYTLATNVENGSRTFWEGNLTGNALDNSLNGSWGVDTLDGGAGADTLSGFAGNDTLTGGLGNDTYRVGRGYEADTIIENDATAGNTDIAQFLSGVSAEQLWFQKVGNNLETSIIGTADKLVIKDWYLGNAYHVEQFQTTDGAQTLIDSNVQNLVNAMASFAPPAAGQTTLPQTYQDALAGVIAANWQ